MTTGFRLHGSAGNLQIDDETPTYIVAERGSITPANYEYRQNPGWDLGNRHRVQFAVPYNTQAPPLVFLRFQTDGYAMNMFTMEGGPGNWTGFNISVGQLDPYYNAEDSIVYHLITQVGSYLQWFTAIPCIRSSAQIGMRIRNRQTGALMFDSGWPLVKFMGQTSVFQPLGRLQHTHSFLRYGVGRPAGDNVYFLANAISGVFAADTDALPIMMGVGVEAAFPNQQLIYCYSAKGDAPYQSYLWTILFAKPGN